MLPVFIAEFVGTGLLLFLGCMGCVTQAAALPVTHHLPSAVFGFVVMTVIQVSEATAATPSRSPTGTNVSSSRFSATFPART